MSKQKPDRLTELQNSIKRRYANRAEFLGHLAAFVVLVGGFWLWARPLPGESAYGLIAFITLSWLSGLAVHFVNYVSTEGRERTLQATIERYLDLYGADDGYDRLVRLSEDGELVEADWEAEPVGKRKRE
jgi:hypothetical protein